VTERRKVSAHSTICVATSALASKTQKRTTITATCIEDRIDSASEPTPRQNIAHRRFTYLARSASSSGMPNESRKPGATSQRFHTATSSFLYKRRETDDEEYAQFGPADRCLPASSNESHQQCDDDRYCREHDECCSRLAHPMPSIEGPTDVTDTTPLTSSWDLARCSDSRARCRLSSHHRWIILNRL